jgi:formylglycine-generating enzyme required for sulfatase activity
MGQLAPQHHAGQYNPREKVSWYQSVAFSRWLNQRLQGLELPVGSDYAGNSGSGSLIVGQNAEVRLPLEWEWQWAAQGTTEERKYPWGNEWQTGYANTKEANLGQTLAVGMYPQGRALCGAYDMSGNVSEWCLNKYSKNGNGKAVRGGSFYDDRRAAACTYRDGTIPSNPNRDLGFRLVISSPVKLSNL